MITSVSWKDHFALPLDVEHASIQQGMKFESKKYCEPTNSTSKMYADARQVICYKTNDWVHCLDYISTSPQQSVKFDKDSIQGVTVVRRVIPGCLDVRILADGCDMKSLNSITAGWHWRDQFFTAFCRSCDPFGIVDIRDRFGLNMKPGSVLSSLVAFFHQLWEVHFGYLSCKHMLVISASGNFYFSATDVVAVICICWCHLYRNLPTQRGWELEALREEHNDCRFFLIEAGDLHTSNK